MEGKIIEVNYSRDLVAFEVNGDYGVDCGILEILDSSDGFEIDDIITGDLDNTQAQRILITNQRTGERIHVCIEDFGMTDSAALEAIM